MKGLAFLLMAVILLHSACIGRCWGEAAAVPPCHQQEEDDDATLCSEGPVIQTKISPPSEPVTMPIPISLASALHSDSARPFGTVSPPPLRFTVLRI